MVYVLATAGYGMTTDKIAEIINRERLHIRADGNLVTSAQVYAAVCRNRTTFIKEGGRILLAMQFFIRCHVICVMSVVTLQKITTGMTYQDYFRNSDFEDIWIILNGFYLEPDELKTKYQSLFETIKTLPIIPEHSASAIKMRLDSENEILVEGAPDPQEWLVGRDVEIDFTSGKDEVEEDATEYNNDFKTFDMLSGKEKRQLARECDTATLAAHLFYWSTLYAIKPQQEHEREFNDWLTSLEKNDVRTYEVEKECITDSFRRKQRKYWRETVANDSPFDWSWNLVILKKKIEYNIGFWRYVQRYVGWEEDVKRMQTAVKLIKIVTSDFDIRNKYVNTRTGYKYTKMKDRDEPDMHKLYLSELYGDKAFHILWKWLDHNMQKWWD